MSESLQRFDTSQEDTRITNGIVLVRVVIGFHYVFHLMNSMVGFTGFTLRLSCQVLFKFNVTYIRTSVRHQSVSM